MHSTATGRTGHHRGQGTGRRANRRLLPVRFGRRDYSRNVVRLGPQGRQQLPHVDAKEHVELFGGVRREHVRTGRGAERFDLAGETLVGDGIEAHDDVLAFVKVGTIELAHLGHDFELGEVKHLGHRNARLNLIALANVGQLHTEHHGATAVLLDRH